jgi:hypothetical protein
VTIPVTNKPALANASERSRGAKSLIYAGERWSSPAWAADKREVGSSTLPRPIRPKSPPRRHANRCSVARLQSEETSWSSAGHRVCSRR